MFMQKGGLTEHVLRERPHVRPAGTGWKRLSSFGARKACAVGSSERPQTPHLVQEICKKPTSDGDGCQADNPI